MLPSATTITASAGSTGTYTATVLFSDAAKAPFVRVGDVLRDRLGNEYNITGWASFPSDFSTGTSMNLTSITADIAPATFGGFGNASVFTPGQIDVRPAVQSAGLVNTQTLNSGQNFSYNLTCTWFDAAKVSNATVGDHVMDSSGKVYEIISTNSGATSIVAEEVVKEGVTPKLGSATIYRPTAELSLFQGTPVSDPARTVVRNRDDFNIDTSLKSLQDQIDSLSSGGSGSVVQSDFLNDSGSAIVAFSPVAVTSSGGISSADVSSEVDSLAVVGVTTGIINHSTSGPVVMSGRLENITTSAALNSKLFISRVGDLTEVKPSIGVGSFVEGDFVVAVGTVVENASNPANKDLIVNIQVIGQL
jgi:hypothetical protein